MVGVTRIDADWLWKRVDVLNGASGGAQTVVNAPCVLGKMRVDVVLGSGAVTVYDGTTTAVVATLPASQSATVMTDIGGSKIVTSLGVSTPGTTTSTGTLFMQYRLLPSSGAA